MKLKLFIISLAVAVVALSPLPSIAQDFWSQIKFMQVCMKDDLTIFVTSKTEMTDLEYCIEALRVHRKAL